MVVDILRQAQRVRRRRGTTTVLRSLVPAGYRLLWPHLPAIGHREVRRNGVRVRQPERLLDPVVPGRVKRLVPSNPRNPDYEAALVGLLREWIRPGDDVVVVGGGEGVSTVVAARRAGPDGRVVTYEAHRGQAEKTAETVELNDPPARVSVTHSVVGRFSEESQSRYGAPGDPARIPPGAIPDCDVLELDCEGAELAILEDLSVSPRAILVETHGFAGATEAKVRSALDDAGYEVQQRRPLVEERGICVLAAVRRDG